MNRQRAARLLEGIQGASVVVLGDLILDEYVVGSASRLSPEAPVPVVDVAELRAFPGGAANVAKNVARLGAEALLIGVVGDDAEGEQLAELLAGERGLTTVFVTDPRRQTTKKTRVVASGHQIVRFDREVRRALSPEIAAKVSAELRRRLDRGSGALILSDYQKGVLSEPVLRAAIDDAKSLQLPCVIDPKLRDFRAYRGATLLTPNLAEARAAADAEHSTPTREILETLVERFGASVLVTEGEAGMTLQSPGEASVHLPARLRQVFDLTGAGDTVVAVLSAALASGATLLEAAELSNAAAGVAVSKPGIVAVEPSELLLEFE
ncbi:MAG: PfkB family carbohydrate kinase [Myxococcota bacterium]